MKNILNKLLAVLLAAAALVGLSVGCAKKPAAAQPSPVPAGSHARQAGRRTTAPSAEASAAASAAGPRAAAPAEHSSVPSEKAPDAASFLDTIPAYSGTPYTAVNGNVPFFTDAELTDLSYEAYSPLDALGRCGVCAASIGTDLMPTEPRRSIQEVKPTGWVQRQYDFVDGGALYNRCHLIGFQLTGENANASNLITGTRYMNTEGMLPFENLVADYVKETGNHVLYRVTPVFEGANLVADGVLMEARSVEDDGEGVEFCVYAYNVQPGIEINYATGENWLDSGKRAEQDVAGTYVLNANSRKFHTTDCPNAASISAANRTEYTGPRSALIEAGYTPCGQCHP